VSSQPVTLSKTISFRMNEPMRSTLKLVDDQGLESLSQRVYTFEPVADALPMVSMLQPVADESVLATATVDLEASVQDDIGSLELSLNMKVANSEDAPAQLARETGRQPALNVTHTLDLEPMKLSSGTVLEVWAMGLDVYELDGVKH